MAIVVNEPTAGGRLGASLGMGLSQGLQTLAEMKLKEFSQKQQAAGIRSLMPNMTEQQAYSLASLPPQALSAVLKTQMNQPYEQKLASLFAGEEAQQLPSQQMGAEIQGALQRPSEVLSQGVQVPGSQGVQAQQVPMQPSPVNKYAGLKAKDIATLRKLEQGEEKVAIQKQESARKYIEPYVRAAEKSVEMNKHHRNIIKAAQSGELRAGTKQAMMERLGMGNYWRNPTTQQAQTDINALAMGVASAFGPGMGRILSKEFEAYKDSLIRSWNTPEGMVTIARNEMLKNDLIKAKQDVRRNIVKQNKGIVPFDIEAQVDESVMPIAQEIGKKMDKNFQELLENKMPKWGNKELNPALFKEDTRVKELIPGGRPYGIVNGTWEPIY